MIKTTGKEDPFKVIIEDTDAALQLVKDDPDASPELVALLENLVKRIERLET